MPVDDGWDWIWLYYAGTVILHMSDYTFWRCSPRLLAALTKAYNEANGATKGEKKKIESEVPTGFIDQVLF